jgi:MFS family permease
MAESDGARLLGQLSLFFVLMALPAGLIGGSIGRRRTILIGIVGLTACMVAMFVIPAETLSISLTRLPVLGNVPVVGVVLMLAGISWALININSLPMVVDMTDDLHIGTYTGLYYLFSTMAAILGPNVNGLIIQLSGSNYSSIMVIGPIFMVLAFILMVGVRRGEAKPRVTAVQAQP